MNDYLNKNEIPLFARIYDYYLVGHRILKSLPKIERHTLGEKLDGKNLLLLEMASRLKYASKEEKIKLLEKMIIEINFIKIIFRAIFDLSSISILNFINVLEKIEEIGKMAGGFKKYLLNYNN